MDLERLKRERTVYRSSFTRTKNRFLEKCDMAEDLDLDGIRVIYELLQEKADQLFDIEERVRQKWLEDLDYMTNKEFDDDCETTDKYKYAWGEIKLKYKRVFPSRARSREPSENLSVHDEATVKSRGSRNPDFHSVSNSSSINGSKRKFTLPKIKFMEFDGKVKNWLSFWGQFKKIDEADDIDIDDKFQYLIQATLPGSPARELVESFPPSGENYRAAINQIKERFARDDLLIEIYVRELLNLILSQGPERTSSLRSLYDKLNTQLRALETLGVTTDKYAAMLYPLVESAIPEDVLRAWERSRGHAVNTADNLQNLLEFVRREVESEERIKISRNGLSGIDDYNLASTSNSLKQPTASCLVSTEPKKDAIKSNMCVWCEKPHSSLECFKAAKMTLDERKEYLMKRGACFICLKINHTARNCKSYIKCIICARRHTVLLCPGTQNKSNTLLTQSNKNEHKNSPQNQTITEASASQSTNTSTLLQTLLVKIEHGGKSLITRAFIDSGAQRSYIRRDIVQTLGLVPVERVKLAHSLFGGIKTDKEDYGIYCINIKSLNEEFEFGMTALDKTKVCGNIPRLLESDRLMTHLIKNNIYLSDKGENAPEIGLLIGADYSGMILTDCFIQLEDNLTAIKTRLGWTIQGRLTTTCPKLEYLSNHNVTDLWVLETIGIRDPIEIKARKESEVEILNFYEKTVKFNEAGRYEVHLPWKLGHQDLMTNRDIAMKRLESTTKKLIQTNNYDEYDKTFKDGHYKNYTRWRLRPIIYRLSGDYSRPIQKSPSVARRMLKTA